MHCCISINVRRIILEEITLASILCAEHLETCVGGRQLIRQVFEGIQRSQLTRASRFYCWSSLHFHSTKREQPIHLVNSLKHCRICNMLPSALVSSCGNWLVHVHQVYSPRSRPVIFVPSCFFSCTRRELFLFTVGVPFILEMRETIVTARASYMLHYS